MSRLFFTPGPTQLHAKMPQFIQDALSQYVPSWSHRSAKFDKLFEKTAKSIRKILGAPDKMQVFFVGSGTEAMERVIQNCAAKTTFHFVNGAFSERFLQNGKELGKNARAIQVPLGEAFDFDHTTIPDDTELICCTHNETSSGVMLRGESFVEIKKRHPDKFLAVDIVSSAPYVELDFEAVDCTFFSVQKAFGLPAGLGVLLVNEAAIAKSLQLFSSGVSIGCFHNFPTLLNFAKKFETPATPNVLAIYLLSRVLDDYLEYGIDLIRKETDLKARAIYNAFEKSAHFQPYVKDRRYRSATVITLDVHGDLKSLKQHLEQHDIEVGAGYGSLKDSQIRIANFPMHAPAQIEQLIGLLNSWRATV